MEEDAGVGAFSEMCQKDGSALKMIITEKIMRRIVTLILCNITMLYDF